MHHRKYPKYRSAHNILKLNVNTLQCYISENVYIKGKIFQNNIIFRKCLQSSKISPTKQKIKNKKKNQYNSSILYSISLNGNRVLEAQFLFKEIEYKILEFHWVFFFFWGGSYACSSKPELFPFPWQHKSTSRTHQMGVNNQIQSI